MAVTTFLPVAQVRRRDDARPRNQAVVQSIADSMREVGQLTPVVVRPSGDGFELIAGSHRLDAVGVLGWSEIMAIYAEHDDDLHAEMAMIDENLCRSELSPAENAKQLARRKEIYEELHPETRHVTERGGPGRGWTTDKLAAVKNDSATGTYDTPNASAPSFTTATAAATGKSERDVRRATERGEKILPEVLSLLEGTKLNTGAYLDKLKALPGNEQYKAVTRDLANSRRDEAAGKAPGGKVKAAEKKPKPNAGVEPGPAYDQLIAALDTLDGVVVADVLRDCPPRQRALLCQRASSAIDLLGGVMEGASQ